MKDKVNWGRNSLSAAVSLALASAVGAQAQDVIEEEEEAQQPKVLEEVVVTSFRRSLQNSIDLKASETSIVEAVSAEEIGKLPDVSIAESLARLPGLAAQRLNGRGQVISVRGLAPDFTTALLNGRPQVSTGDNRGVEFDQYPSELLSSVVVYKTPDASLIGQGLAGTADLRTIRPLEYGEQAIAGNIRYEQNELDALNAGSTDDGVRFSFSYVDQFADDKFGLAIGFAHMTNPSQEKRFNAWGYRNLADATLPLSDPNDPDSERLTPADYGLADDDLVINGAKPFVRSSELERDGLIAVMEWQPTDRFSTALDIYASDFSETQLLRGIEFPLGDAQDGADTFLVPGNVSNGVVTSGTFMDVKGVVRNDVNFRDAELRAFGWEANYDINDNWTAGIDVSFSSVERRDQLLETYSGTGATDEFSPDGDGGPLDNLSFVLNGESAVFSSELNYDDPNLIRLTSPHGWGNNNVDGGQLGYTNNPRIQDELSHFTLSAERFSTGGTFSSIEFGLNYNERIKSLVADEFYLGLANGDFEAPLGATNGFTDLSFLGIGNMVSYDPLQAFNDGLYTLSRNTFSDVVIKSWSVKEEVTLAYVQMNIDTQGGRVPLTGNIGVQVVHTDQSSNAFGAVPDAQGFLEGVLTLPVSAGKDYTLTLPSLNLSWEIGDQKYLRFGAARTLARPRMDELRASGVVTFNDRAACVIDPNDPTDDGSDCNPNDLDDSAWSANGGNPLLDPWLADSADLSFEMYFPDDLGYIAIAAFYKQLDSYIFDQDLAGDFSDFPTGDLVTLTDIGRVSQPDNGTGGHIKGLEFALTYNFDSLWPKLRGLGVFMSASKNDSSVIQDPDDPSLPLPGLSEDIRNITVFYERGGFSSRVSSRYRSQFLGEVSGFGAGRDLTLVEEESIVDAQIGYSWSSGPLANLSVFLQGNNLSDEPFRTFLNNDPRQVRDFQRYGRSFMLGASYKY
ncbi:MAG: TonB-dependent receptor [Gammaproteobacteria bacterium]|nr:TonB-dependent receptor [Gammaproteobacteria bacterium]NNF61986.1 TonB-dependent receptor [Gammaproteobacteria bacterium]